MYPQQDKKKMSTRYLSYGVKSQAKFKKPDYNNFTPQFSDTQIAPYDRYGYNAPINGSNYPMRRSYDTSLTRSGRSLLIDFNDLYKSIPKKEYWKSPEEVRPDYREFGSKWNRVSLPALPT